uniref:Uncharacterized protein n=1 Tax=viral metagenome TaxID=1070528 RepID=A0A6M3L707_9ZZZZ
MTNLLECKDRDGWLVRTLVELKDPMWEFMEISGHIDKDDPLPWMEFSTISQYVADYPMCWSNRIRCAWKALRGTLWGHSWVVYHKEDALRIVDGLNQVIEKVWPENANAS